MSHLKNENQVSNTMKTKMFNYPRFLCVILWLGLSACAERAAEINTVQPNYTHKELFTGEWYFQQTVTEVAPEGSLGFAGYESSLEKIRWEITEHTLYALQSYEPIPGLNDSETRPGSEDYADGVVAAYPIISHFDIMRAYNPSTGEASNVTEENTVDRPWSEREYMRVNWGGNHIDGPASMSYILRNSKNSDFIRDHERFDPDHLLIGDDYIQFSTQGDLRDGGRTCWLAYGVTSCADAEIRIRTSIYRVKEEDRVGFKPMKYPDYLQLAHLKGSNEVCPHNEYSPEFARECSYLRSTAFGFGENGASVSFACTPEFNEILSDEVAGYTGFLRDDSCGITQLPVAAQYGYFRTERFAYDRQLGGTHDSARLFLANHHNIWKDEAQTQAKPIIYYTNPGYPEDLEKVTSEIGNEWDESFVNAVLLKTGQSESELRDALTKDAQAARVKPWMFLKGDNLRAGAMYQIRRNHCSFEGIEDYQKTFARDPKVSAELTEVIEEISQGADLLAGHLLKVCAGFRHYSREAGLEPSFEWQQLGDLRYNFVNWVFEPQPSGPLGYGPTAVDPETGRILKGNANVYGGAIDTYARRSADIVRAMNEDLSLDALLSGEHYSTWLLDSPSVSLATQTSALKAADLETDQQVDAFDIESAYGPYKTPEGKVDTAALRAHLRRRLTHPVDHDPLHKMSNLPAEAEARLEMIKNHPRVREMAQHDDRLALLAAQSGESLENGISTDLANQAVESMLNPAQAAQQLEARTKFFADQNMLMADFVDDSVIGLALELKGVDADEVYRILREEIYRAVMLHEIGHTLGLTHNFSASFDALNYPDRFWEIYQNNESEDARDRAKINEYRYTSIMDYGSRFNSDIQGLGKYDHAAIMFVYSGEMQVEEYTADVPPSLDYEVLINGYESIPDLLGGDLNKLTQRTYRRLEDLYQEQVKGLLNNSKVFVDDPAGALAGAGYSSDAPPLDVGEAYYNDYRVAYNYCADFYNGNLNCKTWDEGASHVDIVEGAIQNYWNYYVFNHYRQGRTERSFVNNYFGREARLGNYITYPFRYYYFYQNYDLNLRLDLYRAAVRSLNFISQVIGAPRPGKHCYDETQDLYRPLSVFADEEVQEACEDNIDVPFGVGRPFEHAFNDEYYYQIERIGSFMSKESLLFYLTDTSSQFFRISNIGDTRAFSIGYYRIYQQAMVKLVRDLVTTWLDGGNPDFKREDEVLGDGFNYLLQDGEYVPRAIAAASQLGQDSETLRNSARLEAPINYNMVWTSLLLNTVFNTSTYDGRPDFADYILVAEQGSGEDRMIAAGQEEITFTYPHSGVKYRATQTLDGLSIGYEVLRRAQLMVEQEWEPAKAELESDPEDPQAQRRFSKAQRQLGRYYDLIQDLRIIRDLVDYYND